MARKVLTDRILKTLKPAPDGKPCDVMDALVPGFGVRVFASGRRTFILIRRYPGSRNPTRRAVGEYGALTLEDARIKARNWITLIDKGVDPKEDRERERIARQRVRENSFRAVVEDFLRLSVIGPDPKNPKQRKGHEVERNLRTEFIQRGGWGERPITEITAHDVIALIDGVIARGAPYQAHNLLGHARRLFNWAIARQVYGLERSPCDRMRPRDVIGPKAVRTRVLRDNELRVLWWACDRLGYPYGPLIRLLALTGQRKSEVANVRWQEFDFDKKLWSIPPERMKMDSPHIVPLCDEAIALLQSQPRFKSGDYVFSLQFGQCPVNGFSKAKRALDTAMLAEMRKGIEDQEAREEITFPPFVLHDIRRTVRTGMSALPISADIAELVIAHARPGLRRVYDQYGYLDEKRRALELWEGRLRTIVGPAAPKPVHDVYAPQQDAHVPPEPFA